MTTELDIHLDRSRGGHEAKVLAVSHGDKEAYAFVLGTEPGMTDAQVYERALESVLAMRREGEKNPGHERESGAVVVQGRLC